MNTLSLLLKASLLIFFSFFYFILLLLFYFFLRGEVGIYWHWINLTTSTYLKSSKKKFFENRKKNIIGMLFSLNFMQIEWHVIFH